MTLENKIVTLAETIGADVRELNNGKVDKVTGKGLSDTNFTQAEKTKLDGIDTGATKNRADTLNADKTHTHTTAQVTGLDAALATKASKAELTAGLSLKVDTVTGKGLSDTNFTQVEKTKLTDIATGATKNRVDTLNADKVHTHTTAQVTGLDDALDSKVDKVTGKGLSDTNFTQVEKTKLTDIATGATKNRVDTLNADKVHTHTTAQVTGLDDALESKVDKVTGKVLSDTNFTQAEKTKLTGIDTGATKNRADSANADKVHTHTTAQVTGLDTALGTKVDKVAGKGLSDTNFTQAEKTKLSSLESSKFVGLFASDSALPTSGSAGDYADVDGGVGKDVYRVIWDSSDTKWVRVQGATGELTPAQIKQQYESNPDTNAFTDVDKTKLTGIATGATKNRADTLNADKTHTHTTAQITGLDTTLGTKASKTELTDGLALKVDKVTGKGLSDTNFTQVEKTKLTGIDTGATKNRADTLNADKVHTHTTAQVTGLDTALESKASKTELTDGLGLKVDKVAGKGLSDTNFTQAEKTKLADVGDTARDFVDDYILARG